MRVLVAGSTGAIGTPVVEQLVGRGHTVFGLTRSEAKAEALRHAGASPLVGDVFDPVSMDEIMREVRPEAVAQLLNALPKRGPMRPKELEATNRLRTAGTRTLLRASLRAGVRRYVAESMIFGYGYGDAAGDSVTEESPFPVAPPWPALAPALDALENLESQVLRVSANGEVEGVVLRFGLFYGPRVGSTEFMAKMLKRRLLALPGGATGVVSWIHIHDAASAAVAALESSVGGEIFNVVDDVPASFGDHVRGIAVACGYPKPYKVPKVLGLLGGRYAALMFKTNLRVSNAKIKSELGWAPTYPSFRDGLERLDGDSSA